MLHSKKYQNGKVFTKSDVILMPLGVLTSKHLQILDAFMHINIQLSVLNSVHLETIESNIEKQNESRLVSLELLIYI